MISLSAATMPCSRFAALARPFPWCKLVIHACLVKLKRISECEQNPSNKCQLRTHPNCLASRRAAFHDGLAFLDLGIGDCYPTCTCIELENICLPYSMPSCALGRYCTRQGARGQERLRGHCTTNNRRGGHSRGWCGVCSACRGEGWAVCGNRDRGWGLSRGCWRAGPGREGAQVLSAHEGGGRRSS
jgi:hypothetical protein